MKQNKTHSWRKITTVSVISVGTILTVGMAVVPRFVGADSISDQIKQLQQQNAANQNVVAQLKDQAVSYQDAINRLQSQITILQGQIADSVARQNDLQNQIQANEVELTKQRAVLGDSIHVMYVEGQISTIEMLATSKNLSDFVDKEEYHTAVQNKIQDTLKRINTLQDTLKEQNVQVQALLTQQRQQQQTLDQSRAEQANMLSYNQSQQAAYNQQTKDNQAKIAKLIAQQKAANMAGGGALSYDPNNGYYPYANYGFSMSTAPGCNDNDGPDRWGYCTRQCVSYAAWAVERSGRTAPKYYGNARDWVQAALSRGIPVYSLTNPDGYSGVRSGGPQEGDVAISTSGEWGHAMYVEAVSGTNIYVSQYNAGLDGRYSEQTRSGTNYYYLRFP